VGADSQPGGHFLSALAPNGFTETICSPHQARPAADTRGVTAAGATSQTPWQSLTHDEQAALIALMAELSLRIARGQTKLDGGIEK